MGKQQILWCTQSFFFSDTNVRFDCIHFFSLSFLVIKYSSCGMTPASKKRSGKLMDSFEME